MIGPQGYSLYSLLVMRFCATLPCFLFILEMGVSCFTVRVFPTASEVSGRIVEWEIDYLVAPLMATCSESHTSGLHL